MFQLETVMLKHLKDVCLSEEKKTMYHKDNTNIFCLIWTHLFFSEGEISSNTQHTKTVLRKWETH